MTPIQRAIAALSEARRRINDEITSYPMPITACDAQYNYLLDARRAVSQDLAEVESLARQPADARHVDTRLAEIVAASAFIDNTTKATLTPPIAKART